MGVDGLGTFTSMNRNVRLLPPIPVDASESHVCCEICDSDYGDCGPDDFKFIDMNGKQASIPNCKAGFLWDGCTVRELYIRFTCDVRGSVDSSGDECELPDISVKCSSEDDVPIVKETPSSVSQNVASDHAPSTSSHYLTQSESFSLFLLVIPDRSVLLCHSRLLILYYHLCA